MARPELAAPSPLFTRSRAALVRAADLGPVVDMACGRGRHALASAALGLRTVALDRSRNFLTELCQRATEDRLTLSTVAADLELAAGIPIKPKSCGAILVFRFLSRALAPWIEEVLAPGGLLLYETFTERQAELPHGPRNPAFLLRIGELPSLFPGLRIHTFGEGLRSSPHREFTAQLAAQKPG